MWPSRRINLRKGNGAGRRKGIQGGEGVRRSGGKRDSTKKGHDKRGG